MIKNPITNKAISSVEQYQHDVDTARLRASQARRAIVSSKSTLLSKKSTLFAIFATGTYLGSRPKVVKVSDPKLADKKPMPVMSLLNTALSLLVLTRKVQLATSAARKTDSTDISAANSDD